MKKLLGLFLFLVLLYVVLLQSDPAAKGAGNHENLQKRIALYGILCLGVAPLIISGGIDLSIGSVVGFCVTILAMMLKTLTWFDSMLATYPVNSPELAELIQNLANKDRPYQWELLVQNQRWLVELISSCGPTLPILLTLLAGACIGLLNGFFITRFRLQPFVVTLCGLFIYRGIARWIGNDAQQGIGATYPELKATLYSNPVFSWPMFGEIWNFHKFVLIFLILAFVIAIFLHKSVYGRYLFAIGANEKTALYSGIRVNRYKILAYMICSTFAAWYSVLYLMEYNSSLPSSTGNSLELYAIAGAVLGGLSLRGGEGNLIGIFIGATILEILPNLMRMWGIADPLQPVVIGAALLLGTMLDEVLRRKVSK